MVKKIVIILVVIILVGCVVEGYCSKSIKVEEVGSKVDLDAYQVQCYEQGSSKDAPVVIITGSGTPWAYSDYYHLQSTLSSNYYTISYDKAGSGFSSQRNNSSTISHLVEDLDQIIDHYTNKPVVLVAHSLGGLEALGYAMKYPERVKGIIFLDSGSPEFYASDSILSAKSLNIMNCMIRITGINRLLSSLGIILPMYGESIRYPLLQESIQKDDLVMFQKYLGNPTSKEYIEHMNENGKELSNIGTIGDLPILVLSSHYDSSRDKVQEQLATYSSNSQLIELENANHYVHWSNQEEVEEAIIQFLEEIYD